MFSTANYTSIPNVVNKGATTGADWLANRKIDFFWYSLFFILLLLLLLLDKIKKIIFFSIYHYMLWFMPMLWQFTYKMLWQISIDFFSEKSTDLLARSLSGIFCYFLTLFRRLYEKITKLAFYFSRVLCIILSMKTEDERINR